MTGLVYPNVYPKTRTAREDKQWRGLRRFFRFRPHDGTLLMFPSCLEHSVDANASDGERVSVGFKQMFSPFTERLSKPLW